MKQHTVDILAKSLLVIIALLFGICLGLGTAAVTAFFLMLLWNFTLPALFGLPTIGFFQTWALLILLSFVLRMVRGGKHEA